MTAPTHGRRAERIRRTATTVGIGNLLAQSWLSPAPRVEPVPVAPAPSSREAEGADARTGAPQRPSTSRAICLLPGDGPATLERPLLKYRWRTVAI